MNTRRTLQIFLSGLLILVFLALPAAPAPTAVHAQSGGNWWEVEPEPENPSPFYDSILYSEIAPRLREIELTSDRVSVEVMGQSDAGRNLFLVTVSAPEAKGHMGRYRAIRNAMIRDPEHAQELVDKFPDFKVPVWINGSIHGNEYPGTDAAMRLIEQFAYDNSPEVLAVLDKVILLVNVVQNPDGRVLGTRQNANGFDLNRDFITASQPEVRATIAQLAKWNPMVMLDLHGFVNPMLIEPCTPPHNPNYEYDLYIKWALPQAEAMAAEVFERTGEDAQIPFLEDPLGWDDWPPTYAPMYAMFHGSYGHTLETPSRSELGVDAHFAAVWGMLDFVTANQKEMIHDQIEIFRRGFLDLPQMLIPDEILDQTAFDQFNELTIKEFPHAYVIQADAPAQYSDHQVARLVDFLLLNDVQVEKANQDFVADGVAYPKGSYIVWMNQPKRGLANTILEDGADLSDIAGLFFYSPPSVWSNPLLWGATRTSIADEFDVSTSPVSHSAMPQGSINGNSASYYAFTPNNLAAYQAANDLLGRNQDVWQAEAAFNAAGMDFPAGTLIVDRRMGRVLATKFGQDVYGLSELPAETAALELPRMAVYADEGTRHALRVLGFPFDNLSLTDLRDGLMDEQYEVFVNRNATWSTIRADGQAAFMDFYAAGGDYIGLRSTGAGFAVDAGIIEASYAVNDGNAIVSLDYAPGDELAAGFWAQDAAFVFSPTWFTSLGADVQTTASLGGGAFLISGFWPGWQTSGAAGMPVVVHQELGANYSTLIGIDNTFRGHPENTFRLLGNAIYSAQD